MKLYEAMFLIDHNKARQDFEAANQVLKNLIEKNDGQVVKSELWEDRKLAYPIRGQKKAAYVLMHFEAPAPSIQKIERSSRLEESVLRLLITKDVDGLESYVKREELAGLEAKPEAVAEESKAPVPPPEAVAEESKAPVPPPDASATENTEVDR